MSLCTTSQSRGVRIWADAWNFSSGTSHSGSTGSLNPFFVIPPDPDYVSRIDTLSNRQNPHTGSLTGGMRAIMVGKAKCKPLELLLPWKVNPKQYCLPVGMAEISVTIKDLKEAGMAFPSHPHSTVLCGLCRGQMDLGALS